MLRVRSMNSGEKALSQIYAIYGGKQCFFETVFHSSFFYRTVFPDFADLELLKFFFFGFCSSFSLSTSRTFEVNFFSRFRRHLIHHFDHEQLLSTQLSTISQLNYTA
jgi:hypothetical protein